MNGKKNCIQFFSVWDTCSLERNAIWQHLINIAVSQSLWLRRRFAIISGMLLIQLGYCFSKYSVPWRRRRIWSDMFGNRIWVKRISKHITSKGCQLLFDQVLPLVTIMACWTFWFSYRVCFVFSIPYLKGGNRILHFNDNFRRFGHDTSRPLVKAWNILASFYKKKPLSACRRPGVRGLPHRIMDNNLFKYQPAYSFSHSLMVFFLIIIYFVCNSRQFWFE